MVADSARKVARFVLGRKPILGDEELAYRRLRANGFEPAGIIDVGAYEGNWTRVARRVFPNCPILMVEPQEIKCAALNRVRAELLNVLHVPYLLAESAGETVTFYEMETGSSTLPENSNAPRVSRRMVTHTLDEVAEGLDGPLFLKIDVQGAELRVLDGGRATLDRAEIIQLEVAMLPYNVGAPTFLDVIKYMDQRGFVPLDYSGFIRPNGRNLVQVDILFTNRDSVMRPRFFVF
jgi:FkbM family methyltransferase